MNYSITITADTAQELAGRLLALYVQMADGLPNANAPAKVAAAPPAIVEEPQEEIVYASPPPVAKKPKELRPEPEHTPVPEAIVEPEPEAARPIESKLDYRKDIAPRVLDVVKAVGRNPVMDLLKKYGVENAKDIDPFRYADFLRDVNALAAD